MQTHSQTVTFIWSIAELLRGDYRRSEYGRVVLPFTVLRRLDCVLRNTKASVLEKAQELEDDVAPEMRERILNHVAGRSFHNTSLYDFQRLKADPDNIAGNLKNYVNGFPEGIQDIFATHFKLFEQVDRLEAANLLYLIVEKFAEVDLHPDTVSNLQMGHIFEELIRRFSEQSNETAGEHFTPREVIRLMVNLLFTEDRDVLTQRGKIVTIYDPACGTGGMLSVAEDYINELNPDAHLVPFGQELNGEAYGICKSDMLIKGQDPSKIAFGNSFSQDGFPDQYFDYMLSNPPFGVEWKKVEKEVRKEADTRGFAGRFGAGLPRISDGSLLFVQHMISKFKQDRPSRLAVVLNGSPLFTGGAGSGESEIRRWIIENDWLEAIVALPDQLFYNTGISTYVWIITNRKAPERRGKVQLVNAADLWTQMRRSLGNKRKEISAGQIDQISREFGDFRETERSTIFDNEDFGYWRITVERPLRLNFAITPERIAQVREARAFQNLATSRKKGATGDAEIAAGGKLQEAILGVLESRVGDEIIGNRTAFTKTLKGAFRSADVDVPAALLKAIVLALSERDETADICTDSKGNPEPDTDLRDYENVPLKDDVQAYFERDVLPHVPDAWIDDSKTKKGYEIPFTRHFYVYTPTRPLEEIDADLKKLSAEIQTLLREVVR